MALLQSALIAVSQSTGKFRKVPPRTMGSFISHAKSVATLLLPHQKWQVIAIAVESVVGRL